MSFHHWRNMGHRSIKAFCESEGAVINGRDIGALAVTGMWRSFAMPGGPLLADNILTFKPRVAAAAKGLFPPDAARASPGFSPLHRSGHAWLRCRDLQRLFAPASLRKFPPSSWSSCSARR